MRLRDGCGICRPVPFHHTGHARAGAAAGNVSSIFRRSGTRDFTQPHVLVIEDEPELVSLLARFLLRLHIVRVCPCVRITHTNGARHPWRPAHAQAHSHAFQRHTFHSPPDTHGHAAPDIDRAHRQAGRQEHTRQASNAHSHSHLLESKEHVAARCNGNRSTTRRARVCAPRGPGYVHPHTAQRLQT